MITQVGVQFVASAGGRLMVCSGMRCNGANERSRTADLFITNEVLCLLSYVSIVTRECPSNNYTIII